MKKTFARLLAGTVVSFFAFADAARATGMTPGPDAWDLGLQPAATPVMERINDFHNLLLVVITAISIFVVALVLFICLRFNAKANPTPSKTTHNAMLEVIWTALPVLILVVIAIPSFKLLYYADRVEEPEMTIKVTGYQWYWNYTYTGEQEFSFDSRMIPDAEIDTAQGQRRLLSVDAPLVIPVDTDIQILITAGPEDVLHSFAVPAFGVKLDAVPGRLNETWTRVTRPGVYYGQCSELCGQGHAYMPIEIHAVSKEEYEAWRALAIEQYASNYDYNAGQEPIRLAQLEETE